MLLQVYARLTAATGVELPRVSQETLVGLARKQLGTCQITRIGERSFWTTSLNRPVLELGFLLPILLIQSFEQGPGFVALPLENRSLAASILIIP
jgi:hypothetical protein